MYDVVTQLNNAHVVPLLLELLSLDAVCISCICPCPLCRKIQLFLESTHLLSSVYPESNDLRGFSTISSHPFSSAL